MIHRSALFTQSPVIPAASIRFGTNAALARAVSILDHCNLLSEAQATVGLQAASG